LFHQHFQNYAIVKDLAAIMSLIEDMLFPGAAIPTSSLPTPSKNKSITLGPGLRHIPPSTILATAPGTLAVDPRKSALWLENSPSSSARYQPSIGDLIVAQIHHSGAGDVFYCSVTPHTPHVILGQLSFEGASKKTRPKLESGDLVYARVRSCGRDDECEIECFNSNTGKAEGMGPLKGGMAFDVTSAFARRLMMGKKEKSGLMILETIGEKTRFEVAVGRNGRVWVDSGSIQDTLKIGKCLTDADEQGLSLEQQKVMISKVFGG
jgi:exosome complex component RRP40